MIKVGEKVKRNPNYVGTKDHTKLDKWKNYFTEIGEVVKLSFEPTYGKKYPVVQFPSIKAVYTEWETSLIRLDKQHQTLKEQGFEDELFEI